MSIHDQSVAPSRGSAPALADAPSYRLRVMMTAAVMVLGYSVLAASTRLWDRDEPRFCRAAVEMMRSGDYLVPTFNGRLRPDKPVLIYWLMVASMRLFGQNEWALRLPSILGMTGAAVLTYLIGRRLFDARTGYRAMVILGTSIMPVYLAVAATVDAVLLATILLAMYPFVDRWSRGPAAWHVPVMAAALGLAQLAKGPVGLAVPVLAMLGTALIGRRTAPLPPRFFAGVAVASVAGVAIFLAWAIPANHATGGEFFRLGVGRHVVHRIGNPMEGHGGRGVLGYLALLPLYVPVLFIGFFPWVMHLPGALSALCRRRLGSRRDRALILGWALPVFVMFSLVATKLPHYILPIFPVVAVAIAAALGAHERGELDERDRRWLRRGVWLAALMAIAGVAGPIAAAIWLRDTSLALAATPASVVLAVMTIAACRAQWSGDVRRGSRVMATLYPVVILLSGALALPQLEPSIKLSHDVAEAVRRAADADTPIFTWDYEEPSLVYYLDLPAGGTVRPLHAVAPSVHEWAAMPGPGVLITTARSLEQGRTDPQALGLSVLLRRDTVNYSSRGRRQQVIVLLRHAPSDQDSAAGR